MFSSMSPAAFRIFASSDLRHYPSVPALRQETMKAACRNGQAHDARRSSPFGAVDFNRPTIQFDVPPRDRETQTCPGGFRREVRFEDPRERFFVHADAVVVDPNRHELAIGG